MTTNTTLIDSATNPIETLDGINAATNGGYAISILISIFFISAIALRARGKELDEIAVFTGAFEFILCTFFIAMQWIAFYWLMFPVALLVAGIILRFTT